MKLSYIITISHESSEEMIHPGNCTCMEAIMDEFELRRIIYDYIKEICHYSQMQVFATSSYQKNYFQLQIDETASGLINFFLVNCSAGDQPYTVKEQEQPSGQPPQQELRVITKEELAQNDGSEGKPAYVAVNGLVYDMTQVIQWAGGTHFGLYAGRDVSGGFNSCHKGMLEILQNVPKVGILKS